MASTAASAAGAKPATPPAAIRLRVQEKKLRRVFVILSPVGRDISPKTVLGKAREPSTGPAMSELTDLSLRDLSAGIAARRFSPVDVVEAHLSRIAALEPRLHAFVHVHAAEAKLAARSEERRVGKECR